MSEPNNLHAEGDKYGKCLTDPPYDCGYDGWHSGEYLQTFDANQAPNGIAWQGYECAAKCKANPECEFYTLRLDRDHQCLLLKNQGQFNYQPDHPHMEGNQYNECINEGDESECEE